MNVIGYVRVSTDEQAKEGVSLADQEGKIRDYCRLYELNLVEIVVDAGESAKSLKRNGLEKVLASLETRKGGPEGLVICKLDRLTRSVADWSLLIERHFGEAAKVKRQLFAVEDSIDTRTPGGQLVLNILMSVSEWERKIIAERTRSALAATC